MHLQVVTFQPPPCCRKVVLHSTPPWEFRKGGKSRSGASASGRLATSADVHIRENGPSMALPIHNAASFLARCA